MKYQLMKDSESKYNNETYKDPLSLDVLGFSNTDDMEEYVLTDIDILRFDIFVYDYYGDTDYIDILLWINDKASVYELETGDTIYLPSVTDMENYVIENIK